MTKLLRAWDGVRQWYFNPETRVLSYAQDGQTTYPVDGSELDKKGRAIFARRQRAAATRKAKDDVLRSLGLTKVRGDLGGVYWE